MHRTRINHRTPVKEKEIRRNMHERKDVNVLVMLCIIVLMNHTDFLSGDWLNRKNTRLIEAKERRSMKRPEVIDIAMGRSTAIDGKC
jgi:hypothetical protein